MSSIRVSTSGSGLELAVTWDDSSPARMRLRLPGQPAGEMSSQPLVEALTTGDGRNWSGRRYVTTAIGQRLRDLGVRRYGVIRIDSAASVTEWLKDPEANTRRLADTFRQACDLAKEYGERLAAEILS